MNCGSSLKDANIITDTLLLVLCDAFCNPGNVAYLLHGNQSLFMTGGKLGSLLAL